MVAWPPPLLPRDRYNTFADPSWKPPWSGPVDKTKTLYHKKLKVKFPTVSVKVKKGGAARISEKIKKLDGQESCEEIVSELRYARAGNKDTRLRRKVDRWSF